MDAVAIKPNEVDAVVYALRYSASSQPNLKRSRRWRLAMLANAIERRAR